MTDRRAYCRARGDAQFFAMHVDPHMKTAVPLAGHVLFQSDDLDCARERVAQKFCNHRLDLVGDRKSFRAVHHHAGGDMLSLNYISYGADVLIDPGELDSFYLIQMPIAGSATIRNGGKEFLSSRASASVLNADLPTRMIWWQGCAQLLVQLRKAPLHAFAEQMLDRELPGSVRFDPEVDFSRPEMMAWRGFANSLFHAADTPSGAGAAGMRAAMDEQRLIEAFLRLQPGNLSHFFAPDPPRAAPRHIKRAEEFLRAHCADPVTLLDIAEAAGVSARTLQLAYKSQHGISPMRALTRERLRRARFELLSADGDATVSETALKWGFAHLGRFAASYRREYGELPGLTASVARHN